MNEPKIYILSEHQIDGQNYMLPIDDLHIYRGEQRFVKLEDYQALLREVKSTSEPEVKL